MTYLVEVYRPAYPVGGIDYRVHRAKGFSVDDLSPSMGAVFEVETARNKREALALCIEKLAGRNVLVRRIYG